MHFTLLWNLYLSHVSDADFEASKLLTTAWSNFMKTGDPGLGWEPVSRYDYSTDNSLVQLYED